MEKDYQLKRHTELWESQNKQIRRIVLFSLIIAYILLVNILRPYADRIDSINADLSELGRDTIMIKSNIEDLGTLDSTLEKVQSAIGAQPWNEEKEKLIRKYREMNTSGSPSWDEYQGEADSTVSNIGEMVLTTVGQPFRQFTGKESLISSMPRLSNELRNLPDVVERWKEENYGKRWYLTVDAKEATVQQLTSDLDEQVRRISNQIDRVQSSIEVRKAKLLDQIQQLKVEIIKEENALPEKLDAEMKKILPNWISGIITLKQMMLYPFLILGVVIYVVVLAFELTRHYRQMIFLSGDSEKDDSDTVLTSLWTLNHTGQWATIKTVLVYVAFLLIMWYFFEHGFVIFKNWQANEINQMMSGGLSEFTLWLGRIAFVVLLGLVAWKPIADRRANR